MINISLVACPSPACNLNEEQIERESFFDKNFWFFIVPAAIILAISIIFDLVYNEVVIGQVMALIALGFSCPGILKEAIEDIKNRKITANILMMIAGIASFFIAHGEEGATAIILYAIAEKLESITTEKSRNAIKELLQLAPNEALLKIGNEYKPIPTKDVKVGDIIGIKPAMKAPLDGSIVNGKSYFDESAITGESVPLFKKEGDEVFAASINTDTFVEVKVTKESSNTVVAKIAESIKTAQQNKSTQEKFIERFAKYYTPIILITSIFIMIIPPLVFGLNFNEWFYRGLILLVVSCPCALTLSTPLANIAALTKLAKDGILVKGNLYIEKANHIEAFAFDKTGTLTEGKLKVFDIYTYSGKKEDVFSLAASLEALSEHPIAKAIVNQAKLMELPLLKVDNFAIVKGKGVEGKINGEFFRAGNQRYFEELNYKVPLEDLKKVEELGTVPILLGNQANVLGILTIRDVLRISAPILIDGLKKRGYETIMISGDAQNVCDTIGRCLDVSHNYGELLPNQKLEQIKELKKQYNGVAMAGDGINDAPALATSDLGIAIGATATDLTLETADVVIMSDDLKKILTFIDISKKTNKIIKQNVWTSIIVKVSFAVLTVIGLMTLWLAVGIGDMGVSLLVLINSLTIFRFKIKYKEISAKNLETEAKVLVCDNCQTKNIIPQHHGRDMVPSKEKLVCWRKLLASDELEPCEEELPMSCPICNNKMDLK